jgi:hypothetical protein
VDAIQRDLQDLSAIVMPANWQSGDIVDAVGMARGQGAKVMLWNGDLPSDMQNLRDGAVETDYRQIGVELALFAKQAQPNGGKVCFLTTRSPHDSPELSAIVGGLAQEFGGQDGGGAYPMPRSGPWTGLENCFGQTDPDNAVYAARQDGQVNTYIALTPDVVLDPNTLSPFGSNKFVGIGEWPQQQIFLGTDFGAGQVAYPDLQTDITSAAEAALALFEGRSFEEYLAKKKPRCRKPCSKNGCMETDDFAELKCPTCASTGC